MIPIGNIRAFNQSNQEIFQMEYWSVRGRLLIQNWVYSFFAPAISYFLIEPYLPEQEEVAANQKTSVVLPN